MLYVTVHYLAVDEMEIILELNLPEHYVIMSPSLSDWCLCLSMSEL